MAEPNVFPVFDGQSIFVPDIQHLGTVAGLADDRVLAEILRLTPYDGSNVYKGILPYGFKTQLGQQYPGGTVQTTGANAGLSIGPFRMVVGSRNQASAAPPGTNPAADYQPNALAYWRDIRSGIYIGSSSSASGGVTLAANSSGNPRWDLVYAAITIDANGPSRTVRVKDPSSAVVSAQSAPEWLYSPVTVNVITGTPGASPTLPAIPADGSGVYYAPLAYVWVPNGFLTSTAILSKNIRDYATATASFMLPGHGYVEPASGSNDRTGTYATNFGWNAGSGVRPSVFLPPDMVGRKSIMVTIDALSSTNWSHASGAIIDNSVDWRNRFFRVDYQYCTNLSTLAGIAGDTTKESSGTFVLPYPVQAGGSVSNVTDGTTRSSSMANSNDALAAAQGIPGHPVVWQAFIGPATVGVYVDKNTGALKFFAVGATTIAQFYFWIEATAAMPNY